MQEFTVIYFEGNDSKVGVFRYDKKLKLVRAASMAIPRSELAVEATDLSINLDEDTGGINLSSGSSFNKSAEIDAAYVQSVNSFVGHFDPKKMLFFPAVTEPALHFHLKEQMQDKKKGKVKNTQAPKKPEYAPDVVYLADNTPMQILSGGDTTYLNVLNSMAKLRGRKFLRTPALRSADFSLAHYVGSRRSIPAEHYSLIFYIGKEYSRLIYMKNGKLAHFGAVVDFGKESVHNFELYFSKIMLEMENGGIPQLDNIFVCGEDTSWQLLSSLVGAFPEANVGKLEFPDIDTSVLNEAERENISLFTMLFAVAAEYVDELNKKHRAPNLLPAFVLDEQKTFQFAWHGFLLIPLIFIATLYLTILILTNVAEISRLNKEISEAKEIQAQNKELLDQISDAESKIGRFSETQALLDSATVGTLVWSKNLDKMSAVMAKYGTVWISRLVNKDGNLYNIEGFSTSKQVLPRLSLEYDNALLNTVNFQPLNKKPVYQFTLDIGLADTLLKVNDKKNKK